MSKPAHYIDDVPHLLHAGEHPENIAKRVGATPAAIARTFYRRGQNTIANPFAALDEQTRLIGPCDCDPTP